MNYRNFLHSLKYVFFLLFYLISPESLAAVFDVVPTDKSREYLGVIFGGSVGAVTLGGVANPLLSKMFERFNLVIVTAGVIVLSYIGVAAAINTAREGEALGKKFNLWVPLRALLGMLLMVPSPGSGYSVVQMTVMWIVLNGIGAANQIWNIVLNQLAQGAAAIGEIPASAAVPDSSLNDLSTSVIKASTCMKSINRLRNIDFIKDYGPVRVFVQKGAPVVSPPPPAKATGVTQTAVIKIGVAARGQPDVPDREFGAICGSGEIISSISEGDPKNAFNSATLNQRLDIKIAAFMAIWDQVNSAAEGFSVPGTTSADPGTIRLARNGYRAQITKLITGIKAPIGDRGASIIEQGIVGGAGAIGGPIGRGIAQAAFDWERSPTTQDITKEQTDRLKRLGWIHAGSYYYALTKSSARLSMDPDILDVPKMKGVPTPIDPSKLSAYIKPNGLVPDDWGILFNKLGTPPGDIQRDFNNSLWFAQLFAQTDSALPPDTLPALGTGRASTGNFFMDQVVNALSALRKPIIELIQNNLTKGADPLVQMGQFGWNIMWVAETGTFACIVLVFGLMLAASPGAACNPWPYALTVAFNWIFAPIIGFCILLWAGGATLGVYIPMVPYLIFTTTAIGWFIAVIEAVVAGPIIALSLVQPGGEELGKAVQAIGILANLFLRPVLMIFGFIIAGSLLRAVLQMINFGFLSAIDESVLPTVFNIIPTFMLYVGLIVVVVNQAFSLIYELPNKVMRYIGVSTEGYTPKGAEEAKGMMGAGTGAASGMLKAPMERLKKDFAERGEGAGGGGAGGAGRGAGATVQPGQGGQLPQQVGPNVPPTGGPGPAGGPAPGPGGPAGGGGNIPPTGGVAPRGPGPTPPTGGAGGAGPREGQ